MWYECKYTLTDYFTIYIHLGFKVKIWKFKVKTKLYSLQQTEVWLGWNNTCDDQRQVWSWFFPSAEQQPNCHRCHLAALLSPSQVDPRRSAPGTEQTVARQSKLTGNKNINTDLVDISVFAVSLQLGLLVQRELSNFCRRGERPIIIFSVLGMSYHVSGECLEGAWSRLDSEGQLQ